jgi:uncharacterized protein
MRISDLLIGLALLPLGGGMAAAQTSPVPDVPVMASQSDAPAGQGQKPAAALPMAKPGAAVAVPLSPYSSVKDALRAGVRDYQAGDKVSAVSALQYAAGQGHLAAQWKLGRMFAIGDGVPHDDLKAFEFFSKIADENADRQPDSADARVVADAFVALGQYFTTGIKGSYVKPNPGRAYDMFYYAASYFRDPAAQFHLGTMHLNGQGAPADPRTAARWLKLAADKGHVVAQYRLGAMLARGEGVPRQMAEGLMWLTLAKAHGEAPAGIDVAATLEAVQSGATQADKDAATGLLKQHLRRQRP